MARVIIDLEDTVPFSPYQKRWGAYVSMTRELATEDSSQSFRRLDLGACFLRMHTALYSSETALELRNIDKNNLYISK